MCIRDRDKEGIIKVCRELNELDQNATMVETFAVTKGGETIYGGQVKSL